LALFVRDFFAGASKSSRIVEVHAVFTEKSLACGILFSMRACYEEIVIYSVAVTFSLAAPLLSLGTD
jgi:hypothetical protein